MNGSAVGESDPKDMRTASPLRVLHFVLDHRVGGPHVYVQTLVRALGQSTSAVLVTAGRGPLTDVALVNLRRFHRLLYPIEVLVNALLISLQFGLLHRPALFHVHGAANLAPLVAAVCCRLPVVWHFHETVASHQGLAALGNWLVRRTRHAVVTVSKGGGQSFARQDALLVPGAVDTGFWQTDPAAGEAGNPAQGRRAALSLVCVANLNPLKGLDVLLAALASLDVPVRLTLAGAELGTQAEFARQLRRMASDITASRPGLDVVFAGSLAPEQVRELLQSADVFVLPSRSEACPIALLEAMAMQLPCVATDVGDVRAVLPPAQQDWVCPPDDPQSLAAALRKMATLGGAQRRALGAANRSMVIKQFSPDSMARRMLDIYQALCMPMAQVLNQRHE